MPAAIKALSINTTTSLTAYTCPSGRVAKIILYQLVLTGSSSSQTSSISFGGQTISLSPSTNSATTYSFLPNVVSTANGAIPGNNPKNEYFLGPSQTIDVTNYSGSSCLAKICVIEEVAS